MSPRRRARRRARYQSWTLTISVDGVALVRYWYRGRPGRQTPPVEIWRTRLD